MFLFNHQTLKKRKKRSFSENLNKIRESLKFNPSKHEKLNAAGKTEIFRKTSSILIDGHKLIKGSFTEKGGDRKESVSVFL